MSLDDRIEEVRGKAEKAMKAMPVLIDEYASKLPDIKRRMQGEVDRKELRNELTELRAMRRKARSEVIRERNQLMRSIHEARVELRYKIHKIPAGELKYALEDMDYQLDKLEGHVRDELDDVKDKLDLFSDKVDDIEGMLEDKVRTLKRKVEIIRA